MAIDPPILLVSPQGEPFGQLRQRVLALVSGAETRALRENLAKAGAISATLKEQIEGAGYHVTAEALQDALRLIQQVRRGDALPHVSVTVQSVHARGGRTERMPLPHSELMAKRATPPMGTSPDNPSGISFFEAERTFPNDEAHIWYESLKGLDDHKAKLLLELEMLLYPERLEAWSKRHHRGVILQLCERTRHRIPLILLEGDVGTGKTALAETIGDALARRLQLGRVHLLKITTQVRGTGLVGEMTDLIVQAFTQAEARARTLKGEPVLLLLDEADALATSRDTQQMHHEDKAGVNTLLQRLNNLRSTRLPLGALFITNRPEVLDPAIRRRAALTLRFERPNERIRTEILCSAVPELQLSEKHLAKLTRLTGETERKNRGVPFTASDLTDRLLPSALRAAFAADCALTADDLVSQAEALSATPPFGGDTV
jgi:AAA+ superfamily predicted ATPase